MNFKKQFFHHKYRFDMGWQFLTFMNSFLLNVIAKNQLMSWFHITSTRLFLTAAFLVSIIGVYLWGAVLDRMKYMEGMNTAANDRNEQWKQTKEFFERTDKKLGNCEHL